jgi:farnesyl diphosphate synthase
LLSEGKLNRGMTVASAFQSLRGSKPLTEKETFLADVCGWSIEFLQACYLVTDDTPSHAVGNLVGIA